MVDNPSRWSKPKMAKIKMVKIMGQKQGLPRVLVILAIFDHLEIDQRDRER
jgi:hypothetical protein